jgi:hypothetical protein
VPPEPPPEPASALRTGAAERTPEPALPAFAVFDQLNRAFDIGAPALFENPIEYFANSLAAALPEEEGSGGDPYAFKALIERLHLASKAFGKIAKTTRGLEADLDRLRVLMRESHYPDAVALLAKIVPARLAKLKDDDRREVLAAANLAGNAVFSKSPDGKPVEDLANAMVFDSRLERMLGERLSGTACVIASRVGQHGSETYMGGKPYGAFTFHFTETLRDPAADADGDGRITLVEATVAAGRRALRAGFPQTPVVAGDAESIALFAARRRPAGASSEGTLHALLVGVGKHRVPNMELRGPGNDVARLGKVLGTRERRLFQRVEMRTLLDGQATRAGIDRALATLTAGAKPQDLVLFYFSGHATRGDPTTRKADSAQDTYLVLYDYDAKGGGMITHRDVLAALGATKAGRRVVMLDF